MVVGPTYPYQLPLIEAVRYERNFIPHCICNKF